jgi:hypothetical protein
MCQLRFADVEKLITRCASERNRWRAGRYQ